MNHQKVRKNAKQMFDPRTLTYNLVLDIGGKFCTLKAYKKKVDLLGVLYHLIA